MTSKASRRLFPKFLLVQALVVLVLALGVVDSLASSGTTISAGSASVTVGSEGTTTTVVTRSPDDAHLNAFDIALSFDPAVVSVAGVAPAAGWSLMPAPMIDNAAGTVRVVAVRFDQCATTCPAFTVTWIGLAEGVSPLNLTADPNQSLAGLGEYITSGFTAGSITVTTPATPSTSPTASPTAPPTSTPTASPTATPVPPVTPAPGAPATILAGSGGAAAGASFVTSASVNFGINSEAPDSFDLTLKFSPSVATVSGITAGPGWSLAPQPVFDNVAGTLHVSGLRFSDCATYCPVFDVTWLGVAPGSALLQIEGSPANVLGKAGLPLPATFSPGSVTVSAVTGPQAPKSPEPAAAATTTPVATPTTAPKANEVPILPFTPGWNLLTWGGDSISPEKALANSNPTAIEMIYVWNPEAGRWQRYAPNLPAYVNDLQIIHSGDVIWLSAAPR